MTITFLHIQIFIQISTIFIEVFPGLIRASAERGEWKGTEEGEAPIVNPSQYLFTNRRGLNEEIPMVPDILPKFTKKKKTSYIKSSAQVILGD